MSTKKLVRDICVMAEKEGCSVSWVEYTRSKSHIRLTVRLPGGRDIFVIAAGTPRDAELTLRKVRADIRRAGRIQEQSDGRAGI